MQATEEEVSVQSISEAAFMSTFYIYFGITATTCTILSIVVLLSRREFRLKYTNFIGINAFELIEALSVIAIGTGRRNEIQNGSLLNATTVYGCFKKFWPITLIYGAELPAFGLLLISCEHLLAVYSPFTYIRIISSISRSRLLLHVPEVGMLSILTAWLSAYVDRQRYVATQHCFIIDSTGPWFATFHFLLVAAASVGSFVSLYLVWKKVMKQPKFSGSMIYLRSAKLFENIHVWLFITGLSTVFISINSMMMLCMLWIKFKPNDVLITIIFMLPGLLSLLGPLTIFSMHKKIRQQFLMLMGFRHSASLEPKLQIRQNQSRIEVVVATQADHNATFRLNPEKVDYGVMKRYRFLHCPYLI